MVLMSSADSRAPRYRRGGPGRYSETRGGSSSVACGSSPDALHDADQRFQEIFAVRVAAEELHLR